MAPPVKSGELLKVVIPISLTTSLQTESPEFFANSVACLAKAYVTTQATRFFSGNDLCYLSSYCYQQPACFICLIFVAGSNTGALLTNSGADENYLVNELQEYLQEATFDYLRLVGEDISLEACREITVSCHDFSAFEL